MDDGKPTIYEFEGFRLEPGKRLLFDKAGTAIPLMPKAFDTLLYLVENRGRVVDKEELFREVWPGTIVEENNLTQNISILRKNFGERPGEHRFIVTVPGRGYRFVAEVTRPEPSPVPILTDGEMPGAKGARRNGRLYAGLALLALVGAGSLAFYLFGRTSGDEGTVKTIAVLPFKPLTPESRNESMELGMADSLIMRLSSSESLIVRPLFSVRRFTSAEEDPLEAGRDLAVQAVLDGTIQTSESQIRVSARLLRVSDGRQIWAEQFDEDRTHLFQVQDSIARRVANALNIRLTGKVGSGTTSFEAYESYALGRLHALRLVMPEVKKGISYFERAINLDPNYALAYVGMAEAQRALVMSNDVDPQIAFPQAKQAASRAVDLDPDSSSTHLARGTIAFFYDWEWELAERHLRRAIELDPNSSEAHLFYAHLLSNLGRHDEALAEARRARELEPASLIIRTIEGLLFDQAGQFDAAIANLETAVQMDPDFWLSHHLLSSAYLLKGRYQDAIAQSDEAKRLAPFQTHSLLFKGVAHARAGDLNETRKILDELLQASKERYIPPCHIALLYAALGDNDKAIEHLEIGYREKDVRMIFLKVDRKWDPMRADPRFIDLVRRMKF